MSDSPPSPKRTKRTWKKTWTSFTILVRRIHLYAGLFLLPWVFLYGVTGAMFSHVGLFPKAELTIVPTTAVADSEMAEFPSPERLREQVIQSLAEAAPGHRIELILDSAPRFNNPLIFEAVSSQQHSVVTVDPIAQSAWIQEIAETTKSKKLLDSVQRLELENNPYSIAKSSVPALMDSIGREVPDQVKPRGWCKLNFLALVDDVPARVTYVLRDGHVDVTEYDGGHGMPLRDFFMRLHTTHGRPPHYDARRIWTIFADVMAIAMVSWGVTGLIMWWQIKRVRRWGAVVMLASVVVAAMMYFAIGNFYAVTKL